VPCTHPTLGDHAPYFPTYFSEETDLEEDQLASNSLEYNTNNLIEDLNGAARTDKPMNVTECGPDLQKNIMHEEMELLN